MTRHIVYEADIVIIGGSVSGQLMAQRLRRDHPGLTVEIIDKGDKPVHPFHLHEPIDIIGLDNLKPATMRVQVWGHGGYKDTPTVLDVNTYARKTFGQIQVTNINNAAHHTIYPVHKEVLLKALGEPVESCEVTHIDLVNKAIYIGNTHPIKYKYLISTIPLPALMKLADQPHNIKFEAHPFYTAAIPLHHTNMYQMVYNAHEDCNITRTTLLDDMLFIEANTGELNQDDDSYLDALYGVGAPSLTKISPGRLTPLSRSIRKPLLHWLTEEHNIFTLGRFGVWAFKVTKDVWEDTKFISNLIYAKEQSSKYNNREI